MLRGGVRSSLALVVALAFMPTAGCSWAYLHKRPAAEAGPSPEAQCTSSPAMPITDTAAATGSVLVALLNQPSVNYRNCQSDACSSGFSYVNAALLVGAALFAASAYYGYTNTAHCRELLQAQSPCVGGGLPPCSQSIQRNTSVP